MELRVLESLSQPKRKQIGIFNTSDSFKSWNKQYISNNDSLNMIDSIFYSASTKEIIPEQKQFFSSNFRQQIKTLIIQLNMVKLTVSDEANIRYLLLQFTNLEQLHLSASKCVETQQIITQLMEIGEHLQNIKVLKFKNDFHSTPEYSKYIKKLKNLESLKLCILNSENPELNIITESQNLAHLKKFSVSFTQKSQYTTLNSTELPENEINGMKQCTQSLIDLLLNRIIEMNDLKKLTLNICGKLKTVDCFNLLNQSLSLKHDLERISVDISYHTLDYNIANILQLSQQLQKISINCSSSYSFRFDQIQSNNNQLNKLKQIINSEQQNQMKSIQVKNQFQYQNLQILILKMNFTKSSLVNSVFSFLNSQAQSISQTLKYLQLEISFIYPNLCIQRVGQFISKLQCLEDLKFQCHSDKVDYMRDNIFILRQITKLSSLKKLLFQMKAIQLNNEYLQLVQQLVQKCDMIDINIYNQLGLLKVDQFNLCIYTIVNYDAFQVLNQEEAKNTPDVLSYILSTFINIKTLSKLHIQLIYTPTQSQQEISYFIDSLSNFRTLEILNIKFSNIELPKIRYLIRELIKIIPQLKLLKDLQIQNRFFLQSDFREEYQTLMTTSISSNLFLKNINLENFTNQMYDDYQLLYLQNLLNFKTKVSRILLPQIRAICNRWPANMRKQMIIDIMISFFI